MACVISSASSSSGKTLLSLLLVSWLKSEHNSIQTFKVGPDYLDPQQLSAVSNKACRNLDLILSGKEWVEKSFNYFGGLSDYSFVEGVMGLFDGVGATTKGSTADVAKFLELPIVLIIDARGKAASIAALVNGFKDFDKDLKIAGVVLNNVQTSRHKKILVEVLTQIGVKVLGSLPNCAELTLKSRYLGLAPAHEIKDLPQRIEEWASIAKSNLDIKSFKKLLLSPKSTVNPIQSLSRKETAIKTPIAIAEDNAFHFKYEETKEFLEKNGMPILRWKPLEDEEIPKGAKGLIIPGGFPEQYAEQLSNSKKSLTSVKSFINKYPVYAECGGMLLLGESLFNLENKEYSMAGVLPFKAKRGNLKIGYRQLSGIAKSPIIEPGDKLIGHEFHRWRIEIEKDSLKTNQLWETKGWGIEKGKEGFCNNLLHASWIHLHWASSPFILRNLIKTLKKNL